MRRTLPVIGMTLAVLILVVTFRAAHLTGQSANALGLNVDNYAGISSGRSGLSLTMSKDGESVGSLTIPPGRDFVVAFNRSRPHPIDPAGNRFEFHGDLAVYPEPPAYQYQGRFHPDKTSFQWASEGPMVMAGHDMDLIITRVP
jgi:hypothetical protein